MEKTNNPQSSLVGLALGLFDHDIGNVVFAALPSDFSEEFSPNSPKGEWLADHSLPDGAHQSSENCCVAFYHPEGQGGVGLGAPPLYCYSAYKSRFYEGFHRHVIQLSLCLVSRSHCFHVFHPILEATLIKILNIEQNYAAQHPCQDTGGYCGGSSTVRPVIEETLSDTWRLLQSFVNPVIDRWSRKATRLVSIDSGELHTLVHGQPTTVPAEAAAAVQGKYNGEDEPFGNGSLMQLVRVFGNKSMLIWEAVLTGQSICFYAPRSADLAAVVLAVPLMVAPLRGLDRLMLPYVMLTDSPQIPPPPEGAALVLGTTNPALYEQLPAVIYADVSTGRVTDLRRDPVAPLHVSKSGQRFIQALIHRAAVDRSEQWLRNQFRIYTRSVLTAVGAGDQFSDKQLMGRHYRTVVGPLLERNPIYQAWLHRDPEEDVVSPRSADPLATQESLEELIEQLRALSASDYAVAPTMQAYRSVHRAARDRLRSSGGPVLSPRVSLTQRDFDSIAPLQKLALSPVAQLCTSPSGSESEPALSPVGSMTDLLSEEDAHGSDTGSARTSMRLTHAMYQLAERTGASVADALQARDLGALAVALAGCHSHSTQMRKFALRCLLELCRLPDTVTPALADELVVIVVAGLADPQLAVISSAAALASMLAHSGAVARAALLREPAVSQQLLHHLADSAGGDLIMLQQCASALVAMRRCEPAAFLAHADVDALVRLLATSDSALFNTVCTLIDENYTDVPALIVRALDQWLAASRAHRLDEGVDIRSESERDAVTLRISSRTGRELDRLQRLERRTASQMRERYRRHDSAPVSPRVPLMLLDDDQICADDRPLWTVSVRGDSSALVSLQARATYVVAQAVQRILEMLPLGTAFDQLVFDRPALVHRHTRTLSDLRVQPLHRRRGSQVSDSDRPPSAPALWTQHSKSLAPPLIQLEGQLRQHRFFYHMLAVLPFDSLVHALAYVIAVTSDLGSLSVTGRVSVMSSLDALLRTFCLLLADDVPLVVRLLADYDDVFGKVVSVSAMQEDRIFPTAVQFISLLVGRVSLAPALPPLSIALRRALTIPHPVVSAYDLADLMLRIAGRPGAVAALSDAERQSIRSVFSDIFVSKRLAASMPPLPGARALSPDDDEVRALIERLQKML